MNIIVSTKVFLLREYLINNVNVIVVAIIFAIMFDNDEVVIRHGSVLFHSRKKSRHSEVHLDRFAIVEPITPAETDEQRVERYKGNKSCVTRVWA